MLAGTMKVEGVSGDIEDSNFAVGIINGSKTDKGFKTGLGIEYNAYPNATVLPLFSIYEQKRQTKRILLSCLLILDTLYAG
jgi:hypothetical protein